MVRLQWGGDEWQSHCLELLAMKYAEDVQRVPDRVQGDLGLEAYRVDCGTVYQCYAPEEAGSIRQTVEAIKRKVRTDIKKLIDKESEVSQMLGQAYRVTRWVLITPEVDDKELLKYASSKSSSVLSASPRQTWRDESDFRIMIQTDTDLFPEELRILRGSSSPIQLNIPTADVDEAMASVDDTIANTLTEKFMVDPVLSQDPQRMADLRAQTLLDYVHGRLQLSALEDRYSAIFDAVQRRSGLVLRSLTWGHTAAAPAPTVQALVHEFRDGLQQDIRDIPPAVAEQLAWYFVSYWWISCPLRFEPA